MDPNLFHLDWDRLFEVLAAVVVLSFFLERALALVFEHRAFVDNLSGKGVKEVIAFVAALAICWYWQFDAISMIILREETSIIGYILTAGVIAGGSKGSIKLFHDVLDWKSTAYREMEERQWRRFEAELDAADGAAGDDRDADETASPATSKRKSARKKSTSRKRSGSRRKKSSGGS